MRLLPALFAVGLLVVPAFAAEKAEDLQQDLRAQVGAPGVLAAILAENTAPTLPKMSNWQRQLLATQAWFTVEAASIDRIETGSISAE